MSKDLLQMMDGSMAKSPKVSGGVVMERESVMRKSMNSVLRVALVGVMAMVFGLAGFVSNAEAANVTYYEYLGAAASVAIATGINTDALECAVTEPAAAYTAELSTNVNDLCITAYNWTNSVDDSLYSRTYFKTDYGTVYAGQDVLVTGVSYQLTLRYSSTTSLQLFYVTPDGTRTNLGTPVEQISPVNALNYIVDLSSQSGLVPANAKLGLETWTVVGGARVYIGSPDGKTGNDSGVLIVDEVPVSSCGATTPSDLVAVAISPTQVDLTWTYDGTNNNYYMVFRDTVQIATNITTGSYTDSTVAQGTSYAYTVQGHNNTDTCDSADSNIANVTTPSCGEIEQSSIIYNGTTTAAGDFAGSSFVTLTDIGTAEYKVTEGAGGAASGGATSVCGLASGLTSPDGVSLTTSYTSSGVAGLPAEYTESDADNGGVNDDDTNGSLTSDCDVSTGGAGLSMVIRDQSGGSYAHIDTGVTTGQSMTNFIMRVYATDDKGDGTCRNAAAPSADLKAYAYNGAETVDVASEVLFPASWTAGPTTGDGCDSAYMDVDLTAMYNGAAGTANFNVRLWPDTAGDGTRIPQVVEVYVDWSAGGETIMIDWTADPLTPAASTALITTNSYNLYVRGNDTECGTMYYGDPAVANTTADGIVQVFTWTDCTEGRSVSLDAQTDPITGSISVTATQLGGVPDLQVGDTPSTGNGSGWTYNPPLDDNTSTVTLYATGTGTCGSLTDSVTYNISTMVAPTVTAFVVPANVTDTSAPYDVPVTTFTASDNVAVTGYMITIDDAVAPLPGDGGWTGTAPTSVTVVGYATYTLRAYAKDAAGNVSAASSATVTMSNCVEGGTVTVSITSDPDPADITGAVTINATPANGASNGMVRWRTDGGPWNVWVASGSTYTPPGVRTGTVDFEAIADGSCGVASPVYSATLNRTYETRVDALTPVTWSPTQNGLTSIRVFLEYHNNKNDTGTFLVEYKLASEPTTWTTAANMPTTDGGTGDADGTRNEELTVNLIGLTSGETYDVRMTFIDATDGLTTGTGEYIVQLALVAWVDNAMLHNSNRFSGTVKHAGDWGTTTGYAGGIMCSTCHEKNPATGNIKRVKETISFPDSSTMPGGGTSAAVIFTTVVDGTSDFGDDSSAPRISSNRVCEVCHTFDGTVEPAARVNGTNVHAANQGAVSNHYDNADCIKCHEHKVGFKASCDSCHASPPINNLTDLVKDGSSPADATGSVTVGKHVKHANDLSFACNTCHTGWETAGEMPKGGQLNIGFTTPGGNGGTYNGRTGGGGYLADVPTGTTVNTNDNLTCAVYCHGYGSPQWADAGTAICGSCHGQTGLAYGDNRDAAPDGSAGNGGRDLSNALIGFKVGKHANHLDNSIAETGDPCALCHFGTLYPDATHIDGTVDIQLRQAAVNGDGLTGGAGVSAIFTPGGPGTCSNMECHADAQWDSAAVGGCTMCHGYPPNSTNNSHATGVTAVNHDSLNITPNHDDCNYCHGYKDNGSGALSFVDVVSLKGSWTPTATSHQNGQVTMNGDGNATAGDDAGFNATNGGCDAAACHGNDATHRVGGGNTGSTIELVAIGPGSCGTCHDTGVGSAPVVTGISSHVKMTAAGAYDDCTNCHSGHYAAAGGVQIVNNATVGINYVQAGHGGIKLGGPGTNALISAQTTEAQICWACHDNDGISEWGTNAGTGSTYNYGTLTGGASNWVGAEWNSGTVKFGYKTGNIQSTHAANAAGVSGVDAVANIRCSYCHDVHDLNRQANDTVSGAPYLRGTWLGNPYLEDGAPQSGDSWTASGLFGAVPRGGTESTELGGYQIDQNNGNPTSSWTANSSASLCELCHGNGDGTFTAAEINVLNQFGTASTDWVGTNGHANAALDGDGTNAANIFSVSDRNISPPTFGNFDNDANGDESNPSMAQQHITGGTSNRGFSFRSSTAEPDGWNLNPRITNRYAQDGYNWGADTNESLQIGYHSFSCSKCHNPHASRLPRLMITNCLDTKHNTWDDSVDLIPNQGTANNDGAGSINAENANVTFSNTTSAQNCHRVKDPAFGNSRGAGWNNVTPW